MFLMYTDESGDTGFSQSPTRYYILSGLVVHELAWEISLNQLIQFRERMRDTFGMKLREELHAAEFLSKPGPLARIRKWDRLTILRMFAKEIGAMQYVRLLNVVVDKQGKPSTYDCFSHAWRALIQRFENTITHSNFPGPPGQKERGIILPDRTDDKKLTQLVRRMRHYNYIQNQPAFGIGARNMPIKMVVEDPMFRDSTHSYFIQACDTVAYLLKQQLAPNSYMRKQGGHNYFKLLAPIYCLQASPRDAQGLVRL